MGGHTITLICRQELITTLYIGFLGLIFSRYVWSNIDWLYFVVLLHISYTLFTSSSYYFILPTHFTLLHHNISYFIHTLYYFILPTYFELLFQTTSYFIHTLYYLIPTTSYFIHTLHFFIILLQTSYILRTTSYTLHTTSSFHFILQTHSVLLHCTSNCRTPNSKEFIWMLNIIQRELLISRVFDNFQFTLQLLCLPGGEGRCWTKWENWF